MENHIDNIKQKESKRKIAQKIALKVIKFYQSNVSPLFPPTCRYYPTCSQYMYEAIQKYSFAKGFWMGIKRICRCHPYHKGGFDPVP